MEITRWEQCYSTGWPKELLVEGSWAHPAKFSYNLIQRIYAHARTEGWIPPGSHVIDPFAGVALGALEALRHGCSWAGVELEPPHFLTGQANLAKWMHEYRFLPGWGPWAMIVNGDSRDLLSHFPGSAILATSSPPYASSTTVDGRAITDAKTHTRPIGSMGDLKHGYGETPGNLANMAVSSPPYADGGKPDGRHLHFDAARKEASIARQKAEGIVDSYGGSPGQLANMVVSSPPFHDSLSNKPSKQILAGSGGRMGESCKSEEVYGTTPGNLASLAVSSPPYADGFKQQGHDTHPERMVGSRSGYLQSDRQGYGGSVGNLADEADTFWGAAREIVAQTYARLLPGAHAIFVVKGYVRKKKIVDFPGQWRALCESVGFVTLHEHHAMLIEDHGRQEGLFGDETATHYEVHRKSFFRRMLEAKGSPPIDWETVYCMRT